MEALALYAKRAGRLWLAGFREACALHRVVLLCIDSRMLLIRTGQCFLLNGFIFLGSLFILNSFVLPIVLWLLPARCEEFHVQNSCDYRATLGLYSLLRFILIQLFYIFWFYPLYVFSFILSTIWATQQHAIAAAFFGLAAITTVADERNVYDRSMHMAGGCNFCLQGSRSL